MKTILLLIVLFVSIHGYGQIKLAIKDTIPRWTIRNSLETVKITYGKDTMYYNVNGLTTGNTYTPQPKEGYDSVHCVLLISDLEGRLISGFGFKLNHYSQGRLDEVIYLDSNKKPLPPGVIVWAVKKLSP